MTPRSSNGATPRRRSNVAPRPPCYPATPGSPGPFVLRLKFPAGYKVATHWHPTDEHVTVIEGDVSLEMDVHGAGQHAHAFAPGGYALLPAKMHHAASTKRGAIVQISGMGPFELNYVDSKDDPRLRAAAK